MIDRIRVFIRNLPCIPTRIALWWICRAMRRDKAWRDTWHANIAMNIYDAHVHIKPAKANYLADRLMKHLFKV
jgi:hypothetical protein